VVMRRGDILLRLSDLGEYTRTAASSLSLNDFQVDVRDFGSGHNSRKQITRKCG
jgi:hypothetical protein